jgi:L-ribulose-5-phosphate 4-epimerase
MRKRAKRGTTSGRSGGADLRERLAVACRILAMAGQGDAVWGHATVRTADGDTFWMKPAGLGLEEVRAEDMILVDLEGRVVRGRRPRHSEVFIHSEALKARPDVGAVIHTHPVASAVFASLDTPLRALTHEGARFIPPDVPRFRETTDLIITPERGRAVARTLGAQAGLFLVSHGIVTVGATIEEAAVNALLLDRAAAAQLLLGGTAPRVYTSDEEALVKRERIHHPDNVASRWAYLRRRLRSR